MGKDNFDSFLFPNKCPVHPPCPPSPPDPPSPPPGPCCGTTKLTPQYTSEVSSGYAQSAIGIYYLGMAEVPYTSITKGYFVIENPHDSHVNVIINKLAITNKENDDLYIKEYLEVIDINGNLNRSINVTSGNNQPHCHNKPTAEICSGMSASLVGGIPIATYYVDDKSTMFIPIGGAIILGPGARLVLRVEKVYSGGGIKPGTNTNNSDDCEELSTPGTIGQSAVISAEWWETKTH